MKKRARIDIYADILEVLKRRPEGAPVTRIAYGAGLPLDGLKPMLQALSNYGLLTVRVSGDSRSYSITRRGVEFLLVLAMLQALGDFWLALYNINQVSLRQAITPDRLQGRMNATMRTIVWGTIPVGSFIGGVLGTQIGVVVTIVIGGVVATLGAAWILFGPVISPKETPTQTWLFLAHAIALRIVRYSSLFLGSGIRSNVIMNWGISSTKSVKKGS